MSSDEALRNRMPAAPAINRPLLLASGICGFTGVLAGAFGAHGLKDTLGERLPTFETAVHYHLFHAVALLCVAIIAGMMMPASRAVRAAGWMFILGIILFSGSLYGLALLNERTLGWITPFGGLAFMIGWLLLAWAALQQARS
jgi:uncharacterized membrane protein YgdD (TMEM256/DUF423 family)